MATKIKQWKRQAPPALSALYKLRENAKPVLGEDGVKRWYLDGKLHRDDGPAVEHPGGSAYWYRFGRKHRDDGPAVEYASGQKEWYVEGDRRCLQTESGAKYWYRNGLRHRDDGPAIEEMDGRKAWYLEGRPVPEAEGSSLLH